MGKIARARKHESRMARKRAAKQARKALYASYAGTSRRSNKSTRRRKTRVSGIYKHAHIMTNCGNTGCQRCNPTAKILPK